MHSYSYIYISLVRPALYVLAMASEVVEGSCYEWSSYIRGYHDYQAVWTPSIGEMLLLKVEPTNPYDFAVSVVAVVGHVPKYISRVVCFFLKWVGSVGFL